MLNDTCINAKTEENITALVSTKNDNFLKLGELQRIKQQSASAS